MSADEFEPRIVDKVERLLDLLNEMERYPALKGKLALHGGTAINLFMLNVPRLSVDIDVSYIGCVSRDGMIADRPRIEEGIENVARALGYAVDTHPGGHAGHTFLLRYRGD
ncbi:nucleotidyl transferase AbiEii/AbiGii toxin family protein [Lancefieldella rimae]|uniref:nucleotidyl transferase AbiEii/AbiGii toxin family protein n=1 Tax=Lancefieldella rimae TaxID=1383 RepID=UPI0028E9960A|nr:nucleotidyl transferase AbiEii/AbiGii toxin family protein [Lancefieldella rimae]